MNCIFCNYDKNEIIAENKLAYAILDHYPVNQGHTLIIPKRHFANYFEATRDEILAMHSLIVEVKEMLDVQYEPTGYNVGVNVGYDAGQTIMHLHIHVIPRYRGDVDNPRGGIRKLKKELVEYDG